MFKNVTIFIIIIFSLTANNAMAVPIDTTSGIGGFVSWRDCTTPEQQFCAGGLGSSNFVANNGTGDRSIQGNVEISSLSDSINGGGTIGGATFAIDVLNAGMGIDAVLSASPGTTGRTGATVGVYQGFVYTGTVSTTKTFNVSGSYSKTAGYTENAGEGTALIQIGLVTTATDTMVVDPNAHFLGLNSVARDEAFDLLNLVPTLNNVTIESLFVSDDTNAASGAIVNGGLSIFLNPGDVFFVVGAFQTVANQGGFGSFDISSGFADTSGLQVLAVPTPGTILLLMSGLIGLFGMRKRQMC